MKPTPQEFDAPDDIASTGVQSLEFSMEHSMESEQESSPMICHCLVAPPTESVNCLATKADMMEGDITSAANMAESTTAGSSTVGWSPPSSTPPVPASPPTPDSVHIVVGNITIPARLPTLPPSQSPVKITVKSPAPPTPRQKPKATPSRAQQKDKQRGLYGQRTGAMSTPVPTSFTASRAVTSGTPRAVTSGITPRKITGAETRAALARVKALKAQMMKP